MNPQYFGTELLELLLALVFRTSCLPESGKEFAGSEKMGLAPKILPNLDAKLRLNRCGFDTLTCMTCMVHIICYLVAYGTD